MEPKLIQEIRDDLNSRMSTHVNSLCATGNEVRIAALLCEIDRLQEEPSELFYQLRAEIAALTECLNGSSKAVYTAETYDKAREVGRTEALTLAAEIAEDWITTVSVFATSAEAKAATATKMQIAGAIRSAMAP